MQIWSTTKSGGPTWQTETATIASNDATANPVVIRGIAGHRIVIDDILLTAASAVTLTISSGGTTLFKVVVNGSLTWSPKSPINGLTGEDVRIDASGAVVISGTILYHLEEQAVSGTPGAGPEPTNEVGTAGAVEADLVITSFNADDKLQVWLRGDAVPYYIAATIPASDLTADQVYLWSQDELTAGDWVIKTRYIRSTGVTGAFSAETGSIAVT